jgi:hypothetical protein
MKVEIGNLTSSIKTISDSLRETATKMDEVIKNINELAKPPKTLNYEPDNSPLEKNTPEMTACPKCSCVWPGSPKTCQNCGFNLLESDDPEIIGDYMHWRGEDYYRMDGVDGQTVLKGYKPALEGVWRNIKDIEITDELALRRPWVILGSSSLAKLIYADQTACIIRYYESTYIRYVNYNTFRFATTADLKKAGITE